MGLAGAVGCGNHTEPAPPPPQPLPDLSFILADSYWSETSYLFQLSEEGNPVLDEELIDDLSPGRALWKLHRLGDFSVNEDGMVKRYHTVRIEEAFPTPIDTVLVTKTDSAYLFRYGAEWKTIRVEPLKKEFEVGWFAHQELTVISATVSEIVLDCPIRDCTRKELKLSDDYIGIRTFWTRIDDPYNVGGQDLTKAIPDWSWSLEDFLEVFPDWPPAP